MIHMWTGGGGPPAEYVDLILCRDVFHCTPTELDEQPADVVLMMLEMHTTEMEMINKKRKANAERQGKGKGRGKRR